MRAISLVILTVAMLYNVKVQASTDEFNIRPAPMSEIDKAAHLDDGHLEISGIHQLENFDLEIDHIELKKKNPLKDIDENLIHYTELMHIFDPVSYTHLTLPTKA